MKGRTALKHPSSALDQTLVARKRAEADSIIKSWALDPKNIRDQANIRKEFHTGRTTKFHLPLRMKFRMARTGHATHSTSLKSKKKSHGDEHDRKGKDIAVECKDRIPESCAAVPPHTH